MREPGSYEFLTRAERISNVSTSHKVLDSDASEASIGEPYLEEIISCPLEAVRFNVVLKISLS